MSVQRDTVTIWLGPDIRVVAREDFAQLGVEMPAAEAANMHALLCAALAGLEPIAATVRGEG